MARRVFVSYKYADTKVEPLPDPLFQYRTCRDYVDLLMQTLEGVEIYNGEQGDSDLSEFTDETIRTHLKKLIRTSSITVVLVSKGMKELNKLEKDQWVPWEVQYSLTRTAYGMRRSARNGMLAVIIPDENGSYEHYMVKNNCLHCNTTIHKTEDLFDIIGTNMFNLKAPDVRECPSPTHESKHHLGNNHSYIYQVKWEDFIRNPSKYIDIAEGLKKNEAIYKLKKRVNT